MRQFEKVTHHFFCHFLLCKGWAILWFAWRVKLPVAGSGACPGTQLIRGVTVPTIDGRFHAGASGALACSFHR
jgi:hypothetical protein